MSPVLFDSKGRPIGREYYQMVNSRDDGHFFEFHLPSGRSKVAWQFRYGFHGPLIVDENNGLAIYEKWRGGEL